MSKESAEKFYVFLQQDAAVVEELKNAAEGIDSMEKAMGLIIEFAKSKGFDFTAEDLAAFEQEAQKELSLDELDQINAGAIAGCCIIGGGTGGESTGLGYNCCDGLGWGFGVSWNEFDPDAAMREYKDKKVNPLQDNNSKFGVR